MFATKTGVRRMLLPFCLWAAACTASADVVVVTGSGTAASGLSKEQIADIFLGKSSALTPIDQAESSPLREEFYTKLTGKSAAQVKSYWSKMAFTGKGTPPKEFASSAEVKKALAAIPNSIGYIEKSAVDGSVKTVLAP